MNELKTVRLHCLSTAVSPITHMAGTSGNESIINRTRVVHDGHVYDVPVLSGNALRHKMVREPGAMYLVKTCDLDGKLTIDQANFLFYGGSLTESSISDNLRKIAEMQLLLPLLRLIGGSLRNQVIGGSLLVSMGYLVCEENREVLQKLMPLELAQGLPAELRSCEEFVANWQYTRSDIGKHPGMVSPDEEQPDKSNLMIYSGQHVIPGAIFYHSFTLQNVSRLEVGALVAAIDDWQSYGGIVGGSSRIGHGKLELGAYVDGKTFFGDEVNPDCYADEYRQHVQNNRDGIVAWLNEAFPAGKPVKAKKTKAAAPEAVTEGA